ncbi:MAG: TonB-dependent receptor, partial [Tardiphaga sp.]|nr:TonB-dependent receptor [Tardiphaga sp.]
MSNFIARSFFLSGASSLLMVGLADIAAAQTELPGITVTAPSPIVRRKPVAPPTPVRVSRGTARNAPATPQPQRQQAIAPQAPQQGDLPIVADQFATVTVVPNDEIRRSGAATLGDLLNSKPGITGSSFAPGASSRPIIRGLDSNRVGIV